MSAPLARVAGTANWVSVSVDLLWVICGALETVRQKGAVVGAGHLGAPVALPEVEVQVVVDPAERQQQSQAQDRNGREALVLVVDGQAAEGEEQPGEQVEGELCGAVGALVRVAVLEDEVAEPRLPRTRWWSAPPSWRA